MLKYGYAKSAITLGICAGNAELVLGGSGCSWQDFPGS